MNLKKLNKTQIELFDTINTENDILQLNIKVGGHLHLPQIVNDDEALTELVNEQLGMLCKRALHSAVKSYLIILKLVTSGNFHLLAVVDRIESFSTLTQFLKECDKMIEKNEQISEE